MPSKAYNAEETKKFMEKYIIPYIKSSIHSNKSTTYVSLKINNGIYTNWAMQGSEEDINGNIEIYTRFDNKYPFTSGIGGKDYFLFYFMSSTGRVESYGYKAYDLKCTSGDYCCNVSSGGHHAYCTELIRRNGWEIPDDYPFKF